MAKEAESTPSSIATFLSARIGLESSFTSTTVYLPTFGLPAAEEKPRVVTSARQGGLALWRLYNHQRPLDEHSDKVPCQPKSTAIPIFPLLRAWAGQDGIDFSCAGMFFYLSAEICC